MLLRGLSLCSPKETYTWWETRNFNLKTLLLDDWLVRWNKMPSIYDEKILLVSLIRDLSGCRHPSLDYVPLPSSLSSREIFSLPPVDYERKVCMIYFGRHLLFDLFTSLGFFTIPADNITSGWERNCISLALKIGESLRFMRAKVNLWFSLPFRQAHFNSNSKIGLRTGDDNIKRSLYAIKGVRHVSQLKLSKVLLIHVQFSVIKASHASRLSWQCFDMSQPFSTPTTPTQTTADDVLFPFHVL